MSRKIKNFILVWEDQKEKANSYKLYINVLFYCQAFMRKNWIHIYLNSFLNFTKLKKKIL